MVAEKLAEFFGLQWDTMQRKMKKLGFWCVPERGNFLNTTFLTGVRFFHCFKDVFYAYQSTKLT